MFHGFFAGDLLGALQGPKRAADLVKQVMLVFGYQKVAGLSFVVDQNRDDVTNLFQEFLFAFSQRNLVADLEKVAHRLRAFAVQPADNQVDALQ